VPLLEIVSGPDLSSPQEAAEYGKIIRQIVRYLDVCDGNLEEGSLRCDCNVSVKRIGEKKLGTKVELKNINSFRFIEKAVEYEIDRQIDLVERNEKIYQETRLYDSDKNRTYSMRMKEDAQDYRYFPDPDLLPIIIPMEKIETIRKTLPELPQQRQLRFVNQLGLPAYDADVLTEEKDIADFFEKVAKGCGNAKAASNWIMTEVMREMKQSQMKIQDSKMTADLLAELISLIDKQIISGKIAKTIFTEIWQTGKSPQKLVDEKGLGQISDDSVIEKIIDGVLKDNQKNVEEYRSGKTKVFGFFVGQIMKLSKGQASPDKVNEILKKKLEQG
jgi:aspartyl-tRNA(Asn)/glutamyl-tRNA(Gln) amidotransferase subunit B